ncbi:response regulator [Oxalobacteraceae bacterium]|nr:response regulator [Oxalobacteraceae bacterium]
MNELKGQSALLIEPHQGMRASLHNMLNLCGLARIDDAPNSGQAIRQLGSQSYDLILCEYELEGGQDGQQMLEDLRHHRLMHASTMFFMVTGEGQFNKVISAAELAPTDYILKPFAADRILERIGRALERRNALMPVYQLVDQGDQRGAIAACVSGAARLPRYEVDFLRLRAEQHLLLGQAAEAEPIYQHLYQQRAIPWARLGQAKTLALRGRHAEAQAMLEALLVQQHHFLDAYDWLARCHEAQDQLDAAQQVLLKAATLSPHAVRRLRRLGEVALQAGDAATAEWAFRQVLAKTRYSEFRDPQDHARLVQALVQLGDPVQAAAVLRDLEKAGAGQRNGPACGALAAAMLHEYTGNTARLDTALDAALAGCRGGAHLSNELKIELARSCIEHGRGGEGEELLRDALCNAASARAAGRAMAVLEQGGHAALAQRLAQEGRQLVVDMVALGAARAREGDYRAAVDLMLAAETRLPDNAQVVFNAAVAVLKCLEHGGWDEHLGQCGPRLIASVRRLDPVNAQLPALAAMYQQILKKYNVRPPRHSLLPKMALH